MGIEATAGVGSFSALPCEEPYPGVLRQGFNTREATVTRYTFSPRASFPLHRHPQEQVTLIEQGSVAITVAGERTELGAGEWSVVGPNVEHGIKAGDSGARIVAVIVPRRARSDDYTISGESS